MNVQNSIYVQLCSLLEDKQPAYYMTVHIDEEMNSLERLLADPTQSWSSPNVFSFKQSKLRNQPISLLFNIIYIQGLYAYFNLKIKSWGHDPNQFNSITGSVNLFIYIS